VIGNFVSLEALTIHYNLHPLPDHYIGDFSNFCVVGNFVFPTKGRAARQPVPRCSNNYFSASFFMVHDP
jgi:hypothetical protein